VPRCVGQKHPDLGVGGGADRAGVLAPDPARLVALLDEAGIVDDEHPARRIAEVVDDVRPQVVPHRVGIPGGRAEQALDAPRACFSDRLGQLPAVLPLHPLEQADQITSGTITHLRAREVVGDATVQLRYRVHPLTDPTPRLRHLLHGHVRASYPGTTG
jgi:hypothetical protein